MAHAPRTEYTLATGIVAATTIAGFVLRSKLNPTDVAMGFLLAVVLVASRCARGPAVWASVLSIAIFDFAFVPPYYTFSVHDTSYVLTFGVMLVVALVMSGLVAQVREQGADARDRESLAAARYALSKDLADARSRSDVINVTESHLRRLVAGTPIIVLQSEDPSSPGTLPLPAVEPFGSLEVRVAAEWAFERLESAGHGTAHCAEADALVVPLRTPTRAMGIVALVPGEPGRVPSASERGMVEALAALAAEALERTTMAEQHRLARTEVEAERLRTSLLSSLSHDLRTPLGSIEGAASSLFEDQGSLPPEVRRDLAESILEASQRMSRLVVNLLDMIRVETGALAVTKAWQPLEEVVGVVLIRMEDRLKSHPVDVRLPDDLPLVPVDELLLEQVFTNLLENAARHTPPGTPITIRAWPENGAVVVEVADRGPGIPPGETENIFRKFYRAAAVTPAPGGSTGLGLTICRGIIAVHGGRIWVESRSGGGAAFRFTLPLDGPPIGAPPVEHGGD
jgi:two-component system sensor histidine kinase KdpD